MYSVFVNFQLLLLLKFLNLSIESAVVNLPFPNIEKNNSEVNVRPFFLSFLISILLLCIYMYDSIRYPIT
jgi:hypothetical protein